MVLWSGGVESTSLLKTLLETTDDAIVAHHLEHDNPEQRADNERTAIHILKPHLRRIRDFKMSYSSVSLCEGAAMPMDWHVDYPLGLIAAAHEHCTQLYRAGCAEDEFERVFANGKFTYNIINDPPGLRHQQRAANFQYMLGKMSSDQVMPWLPTYANSKAWHINNLGHLAKFTWSCRRPNHGKQCGTCHSCVERNAALQGSSVCSEVVERIQHIEK